MFFEYAVEPAVISSWDRTRFFLDAFGAPKGRFLAEYPRHWKRMVFERLSCPDIEKARIVERLSQLDKRVFSPRTNGPYDGTRPWLENAEEEHQRLPFSAIIAASASEGSHVLNAEDVDDRNDLWRVDTGRLVQRNADAFVHALKRLLDASTRIVIIDPYFRADQEDKMRPVVAFCMNVAGRATVEVHFSDQVLSYEESMRLATRALPRNLPAGMKVTLHCWRERPGGPRLHNRYLLTEISGVQFGDGIELGCEGHEDRLSILEEQSRSTFWNQYLGSSPAFEQVGTPKEFIGTPKPRVSRR